MAATAFEMGRELVSATGLGVGRVLVSTTALEVERVLLSATALGVERETEVRAVTIIRNPSKRRPWMIKLFIFRI